MDQDLRERQKSLIFIFSLPRSGSTLLQRVLSRNPEIKTSSESWLLLQFLSHKKKHLSRSIYSNHNATVALQEFVSNLRGGQQYFDEQLSRFITGTLIGLRDHDNQIVLEKTPRNHLIVDEIMDLFPNSKFIFLWRNPLDIISSMVKSWGDGAWNTHQFAVDLEEGLYRLTHAKQSENCINISYEDLVSRNKWQELFNFLGLSWDEAFLDNIQSSMIQGSMGDNTGVEKYSEIRNTSVSSWQNVITNWYRVKWSLSYLRNIRNYPIISAIYDFNYMIDKINSETTKKINIIQGLNDCLKDKSLKLISFLELRTIKYKMKNKKFSKYDFR